MAVITKISENDKYQIFYINTEVYSINCDICNKRITNGILVSNYMINEREIKTPQYYCGECARRKKEIDNEILDNADKLLVEML